MLASELSQLVQANVQLVLALAQKTFPASLQGHSPTQAMPHSVTLSYKN